jgi:ATP-dependent DNA ligase
MKRLAFIAPMTPTLVTTPPTGDDWSTEVKFDGWRSDCNRPSRGSHSLNETGRATTSGLFGRWRFRREGPRTPPF